VERLTPARSATAARDSIRDRMVLLCALAALVLPAIVPIPSGLPATPSPPEPFLHWLLAGFAVLVAGLAALTSRRRRGPIESPEGTRRAVLYALVYGVTSACFMRVLAPALHGFERNVWLLALGDVVFITLGVFVWVMVVAENRPLQSLGFRGAPAGRLTLTLLMGLGAVALYAFNPYRALIASRSGFDTDTLVFAALHATVGSAIPDEILFRGYLMTSLSTRTGRAVRIALPALAFTFVRALRDLPGSGLPIQECAYYVAGVVLPLGLWWGLMRDLARGSLWPSLVSHALLEFILTLSGASPATLRR
jgi:membrane protease YdiL (CAAX protease family)